MKKMVEFWKKYSVFTLFVIPFLFVCFGNKIPNTDIWFILSLGKYVFSNGVPNVDPFTMHEGLSYIMQQWGSSSIMWKVYDIFGEYGLLIMIFVVLLFLLLFFYKLCFHNNKSKVASIILTTLTFTIIGKHFVVMRPHIFSYLIFIIEIFMLEKYVKSGNWKCLIGLPILSLILVNLHLSMWYFLFIFLLPFIVNSIYINKITVDKIKLRPLLITMIIMLLLGVVNPYGLDGLLFVFKSYGIDYINEYLVEMQAPSFNSVLSIYFVVSLGLIFLLILFQRYIKNFKLDIRHICFLLGTYYLYLNHLKCFPYFILFYFYSLSYGFKNVKFYNIDFKYVNYLKIIVKNVVSVICVFLLITFVYVCDLTIKNYSFEPNFSFINDEEEIADYIDNNYDSDKVKLYSTYTEGPYYLYRGYKVYIDGRAELFFKSHNGKADIFVEAMEVEKDLADYNYKEFVDKYNFTHIIIYDDCNFERYLSSDERYEKVFTTYLDSEKKDAYRHIYSLKKIKMM